MVSHWDYKHKALGISGLTILRPIVMVTGSIQLFHKAKTVDGEMCLLGAWVCSSGMVTHCVVCSVTQESSAPCEKELELGSCVTVPEEPPAIPSSWSAYETSTLLLKYPPHTHTPHFPQTTILSSLALATKFVFSFEEKGLFSWLFPNKRTH